METSDEYARKQQAAAGKLHLRPLDWMNFVLIIIAVVVIVAVLLSSCGGGGSGGGSADLSAKRTRAAELRSYEATADEGGRQLSIQLTAVANEAAP